jgi:predicted nucleic acid-binding protein
MATSVLKTAEVFLDTSYAIALSSPRDQFHERAALLAEALEAGAAKLVTTRAVMLEIGNALAEPKYRLAPVHLLDSLEVDERVEIIALTEGLYKQAFQLYQSRLDKAWSLTDCASFVLMGERGMTEALTTDRHFEQAGFRALLREELE